jgi:hypothetical protein
MMKRLLGDRRTNEGGEGKELQRGQVRWTKEENHMKKNEEKSEKEMMSIAMTAISRIIKD